MAALWLTIKQNVCKFYSQSPFELLYKMYEKYLEVTQECNKRSDSQVQDHWLQLVWVALRPIAAMAFVSNDPYFIHRKEEHILGANFFFHYIYLFICTRRQQKYRWSIGQHKYSRKIHMMCVQWKGRESNSTLLPWEPDASMRSATGSPRRLEVPH